MLPLFVFLRLCRILPYSWIQAPLFASPYPLVVQATAPVWGRPCVARPRSVIISVSNHLAHRLQHPTLVSDKLALRYYKAVTAAQYESKATGSYGVAWRAGRSLRAHAHMARES
jgi:hypothetical protein